MLNFDTGGLTKRMLVIHGHTDNDGKKDKNLDLGFQRALATYREIAKYGSDRPRSRRHLHARRQLARRGRCRRSAAR